MSRFKHRLAAGYFSFLVIVITFPASFVAATDSLMLDELQRAALRSIWEEGDPDTFLAYEASFDYPGIKRPLAVGGTGLGIAAMVVGVERGWLDREETVDRLLRICRFLRDNTPRTQLHGAFPHWLHEETGDAVKFSELDDGADLVETALLMQGLLIARAYFDHRDEKELRAIITRLWEEVEWDWFADQEGKGLYWHWSPNHAFALGLTIQGFNESLIAYVLALASPTHPISEETYRHWTDGAGYRSRMVFGYELPAALPEAGPLFITHYSFIGLNPWEMADSHVPGGYYARNVAHVLSNRGYCLYEAPPENRYAPGFWGLTASLSPEGYTAHDPINDTGTVAPTAALASIPYTPHYSMQVLENLLGELSRAWGSCGPFDAINLREDWIGREYLAINQLPIVGMVENYRSGLLWKLFMNIPEIRSALEKAGIAAPKLPEGFPEVVLPLRPEGDEYVAEPYDLRKHPDRSLYCIPYWVDAAGPVGFMLCSSTGGVMWRRTLAAKEGRNWFTFPDANCIKDDMVTLVLSTGEKEYRVPLQLH